MLRCEPSPVCGESSATWMINSISRCSLRPLVSDTQAPKIWITNLLRRSTFRAQLFSSEIQLKTFGLRPWSSVSTACKRIRSPDFSESPQVHQNGRSDEAGFEFSRSTNKDRDDGIQNIASNEDNSSREGSPALGTTSLEIEVDCIEGQGDRSELGVSKKKVSKKYNASKKSARSAGVSVLTLLGEEDLKLLNVLGANEEQKGLLLKQHPEFSGVQAPPFLMDSVRLFAEFGMDSQVLMRVIGKMNKLKRLSTFLHTSPHKPTQILTFLHDSIGVKDVRKVIMSTPTLLAYSLESLSGCVKNIEALGIVVDGDFVEIYNRLLTHGPTTIREKVKAMEKAFGC